MPHGPTCPGRIRNDGRNGNAFVTFRETIGDDIMPLLVTDASGRVRATYTEMSRGRKNLVRLADPRKKYRDLHIGVWPIGGGKNQFEKADGTDRRAGGIAKTINERPDEQWLVVHHKHDGKVKNLKGKILPLLEQPDNVSWVTWGMHMATNEYSSIHNVILAGTLFYRDSQYEALGRRAANLKPEDGTYPKRRRLGIADGESRHCILQALCRGNARNLDGDQCRPCRAYIMASTRSGIAKMLGDVFPGCAIEEWVPETVELQGLPLKAAEWLTYHFQDRELGQKVKFADVARAINTRPTDFGRDVRRNDQFRQWLAEAGLCEWGDTGAPRYFTTEGTAAVSMFD